jgi:hypothetical protein
MTHRPTTEHDRAALKAAFRQLMRVGGGGVASSEATRVGQQALSRYGSPNNPEDHAPIDIVADLTIDTDDPVAVRALCRIANGVFVPLPKAQGSVTNWPAAVGTAVKRGADAAEAICTALNDDGQITPEEIADLEILDKLASAIEALVVLQTYARSVGGEE